jgi:hypothetical protein
MTAQFRDEERRQAAKGTAEGKEYQSFCEEMD